MIEENKDNKAKEKNPEAIEKADKTVTLKDTEYQQLKDKAIKADEYWDRILRLQAEFDNTRKRLEKEKAEFLKFANEELILEFLGILDDLERTLEAAQDKHANQETFLKGVEMILAHLYEMLKEYGLRPIEAKGKLFDPHLHEALLQVEDKDAPEHTVVEELQKGYLFNERVIRTAKVKVSKKSA